MTPSFGPVGTTLSLELTEIDTEIQGKYTILWSTSSAFTQNNTSILAEGTIPSQNTSYNIRVKIPESSYGTHYLKFLSTGSNVFFNFQVGVIPGIKLSTLSTRPGNAIHISGSGFPASDRIYIELNQITIDTSINTNMAGSFSQNLHIPLINPGEYTLVAKSISLGIYESAKLQILPPVYITPTENTDNGNETPLFPQGNTIPPPPIKPGGDFLPPAMPVPQSPIGATIGTTGTQRVMFRWSEVSDESGVEYRLQISDEINSDSFKPVKDYKGLTKNFHEVWLDPGTYYWRVKAVDKAGNESNWYPAPRSFRVSEISIFLNELEDITQRYSLVPVLIILFCIFILWYVITTIQHTVKQAKDKDKPA